MIKMKFAIFLIVANYFTFINLKISEESFLVHHHEMKSIFSHRKSNSEETHNLEKLTVNHNNMISYPLSDYHRNSKVNENVVNSTKTVIKKKKKVKGIQTDSTTTLTTNSTLNSSFQDNTVFYLYDEKDEKHFFVVGISSCNINNCQAPFGSCGNSRKCICLTGYANVLGKNENKTICGYKQKLQVISFLLETCLIFGLGHIYIGFYVFGAIKLIAIGILPLIIILYTKIFKKKEISEEKNDTGFMMIIYFLLLLWYVIDIVCFGLNLYNDVNGIPLIAWKL